jgi:hypothetical protein
VVVGGFVLIVLLLFLPTAFSIPVVEIGAQASGGYFDLVNITYISYLNASNSSNYWDNLDDPSDLGACTGNYSVQSYNPDGSVNCILGGGSGTGDNTSWNELYANTLYYSIDNPDNYISTPNASGLILNWSNIIGEGGNTSFNQSLTDSLYAPISLVSTVSSLINLSLNDIVSSIGNWTNDKTKYTQKDVNETITGNWTFTKQCWSADCTSYRLFNGSCIIDHTPGFETSQC